MLLRTYNWFRTRHEDLFCRFVFSLQISVAMSSSTAAGKKVHVLVKFMDCSVNARAGNFTRESAFTNLLDTSSVAKFTVAYGWKQKKDVNFVSRQVRFQKTKFKTDAINYELTFESNPGLLTFAGAHLYNESLFFCVSRDDCATSSVTESFLFLFTSASMMLKKWLQSK